ITSSILRRKLARRMLELPSERSSRKDNLEVGGSTVVRDFQFSDHTRNTLSPGENCDGLDWRTGGPWPGAGAIFSVSPLRAAHLVNCAVGRQRAGANWQKCSAASFDADAHGAMHSRMD